jgi:hypothetical protein
MTSARIYRFSSVKVRVNRSGRHLQSGKPLEKRRLGKLAEGHLPSVVIHLRQGSGHEAVINVNKTLAGCTEVPYSELKTSLTKA